jgi:hypothetical protein
VTFSIDTHGLVFCKIVGREDFIVRPDRGTKGLDAHGSKESCFGVFANERHILSQNVISLEPYTKL